MYAFMLLCFSDCSALQHNILDGLQGLLTEVEEEHIVRLGTQAVYHSSRISLHSSISTCLDNAE